MLRVDAYREDGQLVGAPVARYAIARPLAGDDGSPARLLRLLLGDKE